MTHCIFPKRKKGKAHTNYYADIALPQLVHRMKMLKSQPYNLEAQIFGGAALRGFSAKRAQKTISVIRKILKKFDIPVVAQDTGGSLGKIQ